MAKVAPFRDRTRRLPNTSSPAEHRAQHCYKDRIRRLPNTSSPTEYRLQHCYKDRIRRLPNTSSPAEHSAQHNIVVNLEKENILEKESKT